MSKYIQEMAEKKYLKGNPNLLKVFQTKIDGYTAGAQDMKEHIGGFAHFLKDHCDWVVDTSGKNDVWGWETDLPEYSEHYTTGQLVEKYFEQLNQKQP